MTMKRIVIVDDNQINLTLLWHLVRKIPGYESVNFSDPVEAWHWCEDNEAELIIVDYMMPVMDGMELITKIRETAINRDTPIMMITADHQNDVRYQALQIGASDFLNKPIDKTEFTIRVKNMLALRDSQKKLADKAAWLKDEVSKATETIRNRELEVIYRLTKAAEYRDPETGGHIKRMAHYSRLIAMKLGMSLDEQELILQAAPMHDIGKVGIPDAILLKPGKLTNAEFEIMKEHPKYGHEILQGSHSTLMQTGALIALTHHEKYDGTGYPNQLKGDQIALYGRIVAVADVFDALTSERPYKKPWTLADAADFLKEHSGGHFDPECVKALLGDMAAVAEIQHRFQDSE